MNDDNDRTEDAQRRGDHPPIQQSADLSESSLLEQMEADLRDGVPMGATTAVDSTAAEALSRLNTTFAFAPHSEHPRIIDRFQIRGELGRGQFGTVYLAWDPKLKRDVAIKLAGQRILNDAALRQRFQREAELAGRLDHPGLVRVFEVGDFNGTPFYVMPPADGMTLRTWLDKRSEPVPLNDAVQIVIDIANAMQHGHDLGIIHRDLKPANVMIRPATTGEDGEWQICVLDFGLAAFADPALRETEGPMLLGTPMYMSPEQAEGRRDEVGPASDQFTLGSLLYELLTGRAAFQADHLPEMAELFKTCSPTPPSKLRSECSPELDAICRMCLQREPEDRYASMSDLAADLKRLQKGETPVAMITRRHWRDLKRWLHQWRYVGMGLAAGFLLLAWAELTDTGPTDPQPAASIPETSAETPARQNAPAEPTVDSSLDREIAELVLSLSGKVEVATADENYELGSAEKLPEAPLRLLWIMMPENENVTDELVERFVQLRSLEGIDLYATEITDRAALSLAKVESLIEIYLHETDLGDAGAIALLEKPGIEEVNFARTKITDATLQRCENHPTLARVSFDGTDISDAGLRSLSTASKLTLVKVGDTSVSDVGFAALSMLTHIREINIAGTEVTSKSLDIIMGWPKLRHIYCEERLFDVMGLDEFRRQRPTVQLRTR